MHQLTLGQNEATEKTAGNCFCFLTRCFALAFPSSASLIPCLFAFLLAAFAFSSSLRLHGISIFARSLTIFCRFDSSLLLSIYRCCLASVLWFPCGKDWTAGRSSWGWDGNDLCGGWMMIEILRLICDAYVVTWNMLNAIFDHIHFRFLFLLITRN